MRLYFPPSSTDVGGGWTLIPMGTCLLAVYLQCNKNDMKNCGVEAAEKKIQHLMLFLSIV